MNWFLAVICFALAVAVVRQRRRLIEANDKTRWAIMELKTHASKERIRTSWRLWSNSPRVGTGGDVDIEQLMAD